MNFKRKKDVLVVDDSPFVREMVSRMVHKLGHVATRASDGEEALRVANHRQPDVIVLDVNMPKVDGITALETLRSDKRFAETPIVMLTSVSDQDVVRRSIQLRATAYLLKDDPEQIMKRLKEILD